MKRLDRACAGIAIALLLGAFLLLTPASQAQGLTGDLTEDFQFSDWPTDRFCPIDTWYTENGLSGDTAAVFADVDGINNGGTYGIYDTMVTISTVRGEVTSCCSASRGPGAIGVPSEHGPSPTSVSAGCCGWCAVEGRSPRATIPACTSGPVPPPSWTVSR